MFTLKFVKFGDTSDSAGTEDVICCDHYTVSTFNNRKTVACYKDYTNIGGVERTIGYKEATVSGKENEKYNSGYDICYVQNINGKTIDKILKVEHKNTPPL